MRATLLATTSLAAMVLPAQAQTVWEGTTSGDWFTGSNWSTGSAPTAGDDVQLPTRDPNLTDISRGNAEANNVSLSGSGGLVIWNEGTLSSSSGYISTDGGSFGGGVNVVGTNAAWTNSSYLLVGMAGQGYLTIQSGGAVSNANNGFIGYSASSSGLATVTGAGSKWANRGIFVGYHGSGELTIEDGGMVSSLNGYIGDQVGSAGMVTVSGAGSTWSSSGDYIIVGVRGFGTLTIENGGAVANARGIVGSLEGSQGTVTVSGANSTWTNTGNLDVGAAGYGTLAITDGGTVTSVNSAVGDLAGSQGMVTVSGAGSSWTNDHLAVGVQGGAGTLMIESGGVVRSDAGIIGITTDAQGAVTVRGAGSSWIISDRIDVAYEGSGTLAIADGGKVSSVTGRVGYFAGSHGTISVSGTGSSWTVSDIVTIGREGAGTFTVENGGAVSSVEGYIGAEVGSQGAVSVTGADSTWTNLRGIVVGDKGSGRLNIENGGAVTNTGVNPSFIGREAGSEGAVMVTGPGSTWTNNNWLNVGRGGTGTLTIADGGAVSNGLATLGGQAGSHGTVAVSGTGSTWANSGEIHIGRSGAGTLAVAEGGRVTVAEEVFVGTDAGGAGTVTVTGAGSTLTSYSLAVGFSGDAALTIAGGGAVNSSYGTVGLNAGSTGAALVTGAGSTWTSGSLVVGFQGAGTLTVGDSGEVIVNADNAVNDRILVADDTGSTGTVNIGAAAGEAAVAPGTVHDRIQFGGGTGTLNFNHTATDYVFDPGISGPGAVNVLAGTTIFDNNKQYTGPTTVDDGGTLIVNGSIASSSSLTVKPGGQVGGSGTFPSTTFDGGTASPGNSIGVMNIGGDVTFTQDSTYEVEVDPASSDSDIIHATGTATLGGASVVHIGLAGDYRPRSTYTILTADGGIDGTFGDVASDFAFLDATLGYDTNDVTLTLERNDVSFDDIGVTSNQIAVGTGAESLGAGNPVHDAVVVLDEDRARVALDLLSGEIHALAKSALIEDSHFVRDAANDRMRAAFEGVGASNTPVLAYGPDGPASASASADSGLAIWTHGFGSWGEIDSDGNAASLSSSTGGLIVGGDAMLGDWRLGLMAGYSHISFDVDDRASSGSSDNYHLGLYGGTEWGALAFRSGLAYTWHDIETSRGVVAGDFTDQLEADYDAGTVQAFGELGYRIDVGQAAFEPFANLAYVNFDGGGFTESGEAAALNSSGGSTDTTFTTLGLRGSTGFTVGTMSAIARSMVGWRHAYGDTTPHSTQAFAGGAAFVVAGVPIAEDAAVIEAGLDLNLTDASTFGVSYNGQFASGVRQNGFTAQLQVRF
ncbi:autotransporter domain-containing protein [Mesorhizobium sp.]|uniref:autotransporter domain-containing protein n=1 Tax=Mesorhizobium sp. TaxID=1871066 RepID=UPI0025FC7404|nr:autotransporter domain-containing protein [Mesorhizobium sp.]